LIICDIDNTLLPPGGTISEETRRVLSGLYPTIGFSIATGRSFHVVRKFVEDLDIRLPVITSNGAQVYDYASDSPIYENSFSDRSAQFVMSTLLSEGFDFVAYGKRGIYHRPDSTHMAFFLNYNASVREQIRAPLIPLSTDLSGFVPENLTKILVYFPTEELRNRLASHSDLEITASMHQVIDIMPAGSTKGNAVVALAKHLQIPLSDVYCFGDNDNDISMFTCGAVGIAMGNATEETKRHAAMVTRTCKDDGVAYAIRHLL